MRRSTKAAAVLPFYRKRYRIFTHTLSRKHRRRGGRSAHVLLISIILPVVLLLSVTAEVHGVVELVVRFVPRTSRELRRRFTTNWKLHTEHLRLQKKFEIVSSDELRVHIISLKRSGERTNLTANSCQRQCVKFKIFNAVDGLGSLNNTEISIFAGRKKQHRLDVTKYFDQDKVSALYKSFDGSHRGRDKKSWRASLHERLRFGCYMSHVSLWRKLLLDNLPLLIVLEDDVIIENDFFVFIDGSNEYFTIKVGVVIFKRVVSGALGPSGILDYGYHEVACVLMATPYPGPQQSIFLGVRR